MGFAHEGAQKASAQIVLPARRPVCLPLGDLIDIEAEAARLRKGKSPKSEGEDWRAFDKKLAKRKNHASAKCAGRDRRAEREKAGGSMPETKARLQDGAGAGRFGGRLTATERYGCTAMAGAILQTRLRLNGRPGRCSSCCRT